MTANRALKDDSPVLIAFDGSDHARAAIEQAAEHLRLPRQAIVVSVFQPLGDLPFWGISALSIPAAIAAGAEEEAGRVSAEGATLANEAGFEAEHTVIEGTPIWERIIEAANRTRAGVIVLGSHGRSGARYLVMGSVATAVAHHARQSVLICRLPGDDKSSDR